jgi:hypothetical protein
MVSFEDEVLNKIKDDLRCIVKRKMIIAENPFDQVI